MHTNPLAERNAARGAEVLERYRALTGGDRDDLQTTLADLLADLMHAADAAGLCYMQADERASAHHDAEREPDDIARDMIRLTIDEALAAEGIAAKYGPGIESDGSAYDVWTHERADGTLAALIFDGITWTVAEARDAAGFAAEEYTATHEVDPDSDAPALVFARVVLGE